MNSDEFLSIENLFNLLKEKSLEADPLKSLHGYKHEYVATNLNNLGLLYDSQKIYDKAEPFYLESLELRQAIFGDFLHEDIAQSYNNLVLLYYNQGYYDKAKPLFKKAFQIRVKLHGYNHQLVANSIHNLACLYSANIVQLIPRLMVEKPAIK